PPQAQLPRLQRLDLLLDPLDDHRAVAAVDGFQVAVNLLLDLPQLPLTLLAYRLHVQQSRFPLGEEFGLHAREDGRARLELLEQLNKLRVHPFGAEALVAVRAAEGRAAVVGERLGLAPAPAR